MSAGQSCVPAPAHVPPTSQPPFSCMCWCFNSASPWTLHLRALSGCTQPALGRDRIAKGVTPTHLPPAPPPPPPDLQTNDGWGLEEEYSNSFLWASPHHPPQGCPVRLSSSCTHSIALFTNAPSWDWLPSPPLPSSLPGITCQ